MGLDTLREAMPGYARDTKINLGTVLGDSPLTAPQAWGTAVACAVAARNPRVLREIVSEAAGRIGQDVVEAAKAAGAIMAMNNVYYRAKHLMGDPEYVSLPARLRMQVIGNPGVDKTDFELWCLAVSAVNGCGSCLVAHEKNVRSGGASREVVHNALRIASVINAAALALATEEAMASH